MARAREAESLGIDGTEHIEIDKTVVKGCDYGVSHRMSQPRQIAIMTGGIDYNEAAGMPE